MTKDTVKKVVKKEKVLEKSVPPKQYTIFYNIGNEAEFFIANGTDYKLTTLDIKSEETQDIFSFPVVVVTDDIAGTKDIIPINNVGNIRCNWGLKDVGEKQKIMDVQYV